MKRRYFSLFTLMILAATVSVTEGSSYVMMSDEALAAQAELIVVGKVLSRRTGHLSRAVTVYEVEIERVVKGSIHSAILRVEVPGGRTSDGLERAVFGMPQFAAGDRAILFLMPRSSGTFGILQLMLGAFREVRAGERRLAIRSLDGSDEVFLGRGPVFTSRFHQPRDFERFAGWLSRSGNGTIEPADYFLELQELDVDFMRAVDAFTLSPGFPNTFVRWFVFTSGPVKWRIQQDGQPGLAGGGTTEFKQALEAWTNDPDSTINYVFDGTTPSKAGLKMSDGVNAIVFDDPNNEIAGSFDCNVGGVLGIGGPTFSNAFQEFKGQLFSPIVEGDVVIQDGVECVFQQPQASQNAAELYGHETGHTLGLRHSCGDSNSPDCATDPVLDQALMRAKFHGDGRGAALGQDDRAAIAFLYGEGQAGSGDTTFFFPQLGDGVAGSIQFRTAFNFENTGADTTLQIDFFKSPNGNPLSLNLGSLGTDSSFKIPLDAGEVLSLETPGTGALVIGYARVTAGSGVSGTAVFTRIDNGIKVSKVGVPATTASNDISIIVDTRGSNSTGVAMLNPPAQGISPAQASANLVLRLYDQNFKLISVRDDMPMEQGAHAALFVEQLFKNVPGVDEMVGSLTIESDQPVAVMTLLQDDDSQRQFPAEVPILTAFPAIRGRADAGVARGSFSISSSSSTGSLIEAKIALSSSGSKPLGALYRVYSSGHLVQRYFGSAPASNGITERFRLSPYLSQRELKVTIQLIPEKGEAGPETVLVRR